MSRIHNLNDYNRRRKEEALRLNIDGESNILTKGELLRLIREELDFITVDKATELNSKLQKFETKINNLLSDRLDAITENIIERSLSRIVEADVEKRVNDKLQKIKNAL